MNLQCIEIFKKVLNLSRELDINTNISLCNLYSYLLYTGNLSINKNFEQSDSEIVDDGAANLILGYGCCRNICDGLKRVLRLNNAENYKLVTKFNPNKILTEYDPIFGSDYVVDNIKLKKKQFLQNFKSYDKNLTHALNLVIEKDKYFVYDATWILLLKLKGLKLKVVNGKGKMNIKIPLCNFKDYFSGKTTETEKYLKLLQAYDSYSLVEFKDITENDFIKFKDNDNLISSFYIDAYSNIESVYKALKDHL